MMKHMKPSMLALALLTLAACSAPPPPASPPEPIAATPPAPPPPPLEPVAEADAMFATRCAVCHGASGKGDGAAAAGLNPKPRDYADKEWQASVTDETIAKAIIEGGAAIGKSPLMTPNADLRDKPEVVKALVAKIRTFGQ